MEFEILRGRVRTDYPALFVCANQYRFYKSQDHPIGNWRQLGKSYDRQQWPLVQFLLFDHAYFESEIDDGEEFFALLIAQLKCFSRAQDPSSKIVRRLLGDDSEIRRMVSRVEFIYTKGVVTCLVVFFATAFKYKIEVENSVPLIDNDTGKLSETYRRAMVKFYRDSCAPRFIFIVMYENTWQGRQGRYLRSFLVGKARNEIVYDGCSLGRPEIVYAEKNNKQYEIFPFSGPAHLKQAQLDKLTVRQQHGLMPANFLIIHGPTDCVFKNTGPLKAIRKLEDAHEAMKPHSSWEQLPYFSRRFHWCAAIFVGRLLALIELQLPIYVYNEIFLWVNDESSHLFLSDRIAVITKVCKTVAALKQRRAAASATTSAKQIKIEE